ncbi:LysR family transcriptional regulator [Roseburia sp. MSJ-14]|uniref:LysR family transcriptional regulator n=1 Tax=Roseburia sp. MSJ-14 TaxID=2841514 RepID=UPI001C1239FA|nr:LysR family transcriptional regulator [Roseburia sp. MSJ-14]MBU5474484.1 LysR family transcriptional regulator [Roseburia sp. MSJ-14]
MVNYDYYRIFYFVAQYKSFTKAAELLDNSQPNITRCMNNLEHELNCKLFVRSNRGITLTPEGLRLYEHVSIAYEQLLIGEQELQRDKSLESGLIHIGASETALHLMLLHKLELFHEKYPHVRLKISNHSTPQAITALRNGLVDFAIVTTPLNIKKPLQKISLSTFREILIGGLKYADFASQVHNLKDLNDIPFVSLSTETSTRELYIEYFLRYNLPFQADMEAATTDQILPMIQHNLGIGFYPEALAQESIARGEVVPIQLVEPIPEREVCLLWDTTHSQSIAAQKLKASLLT